MPQALLPIIPDGATGINDRISVVRENGEWTYFCGVAPIFRHPEEDRRSFRMFTAQLVCQGACRQSDIVRTFGVSTNSVKRSVKKYREEGIEGFYQPRQRRGATVMTDDVTARAQEQLSRGCSRRQVAEQGELAEMTIDENRITPSDGLTRLGEIFGRPSRVMAYPKRADPAQEEVEHTWDEIGITATASSNKLDSMKVVLNPGPAPGRGLARSPFRGMPSVGGVEIDASAKDEVIKRAQ